MKQMIIDGATGKRLRPCELQGRTYWYTKSNSGATYYTGKGIGEQAAGISDIEEIRHHEELLGEELVIVTINFTATIEEAAYLEAAVMLKAAEEAATGLVPYIDYWQLNTSIAAENLLATDPRSAARLGIIENRALAGGNRHGATVLH